jgi:putative ABC transport system substrate-binding protein
MRRREFISLLGGSAVSWPLRARAQPMTIPVVGFLHAGLPEGFVNLVAAFRKGLSEAGYIEGKNVVIEFRWAQGYYDRLPELAADLVHRQVAAIAAAPSPAALAAKAATTTIPIVFEMGADPVEVGLVPSLNRPGGNITGITNLSVGLVAKRLELIHEIAPNAAIIAVLVNPSNPNIAESTKSDVLAAQARLGLPIRFVEASTVDEIDLAFTTLFELRAGALVVAADPYFVSQRDQIASLAIRYAVPACHEVREFVAAGGLMSYGGDLSDRLSPCWPLYRQSSQRREASRACGPAGHEGRADHQSQDCAGAGPHRTLAAARPRRRGD